MSNLAEFENMLDLSSNIKSGRQLARWERKLQQQATSSDKSVDRFIPVRDGIQSQSLLEDSMIGPENDESEYAKLLHQNMSVENPNETSRVLA